MEERLLMADELLNSLNLNDLMGNTAKTQVADEIVETKEEYYDVVKYKDELGSFIKCRCGNCRQRKISSHCRNV